MVSWIWEAFELFTDREAVLSANEWFIYVDLQCLLMQEVLQLEYLMIISVCIKHFTPLDFLSCTFITYLQSLTALLLIFFKLIKHFDHLKYTIEINIILSIHKSYSCLIYTWDQGHALGINFYFRKLLLFFSGSFCDFFFLNCK